MKRCYLAIAVLLGGTLAAAQAEQANYVRITVDLGPRKNDGGGGNGPGMGQMMGMAGMPGMAGAQGGAGGNQGGMMMGMAGGQGGARGNQGGMMMGMAGGQGAMRPGGQMMGMAGGQGAMKPGSMMMGMQGMGGAPGGMMMGMRGVGGAPGGMMMGMQGMMGMGGGNAAGASSKVEDDIDLTAVRAEVVVEVKHFRTGTGKIRIDTKWGTTTLVDNDMFHVTRIHLPKVGDAYRRLPEYKSATKSADDYLRLATWALEHGLVDEFELNMDALVKANPMHPAAVTYTKVKADMDRAISKKDQSREWTAKLDRGGTQPYLVQTSDHYALLYSSRGQESDVRSRLKRLEKNYRAFFGWFAVHGKALPVPETRLVAVLVDLSDQFSALHKDFGSVPMAADSFFARRYNLAVFSAGRLDDVYQALHKLTQTMWTNDGWNRRKLLHGTGQQKGKSVEEFREAQMKALVVTAMEEESEINSVTFEGTRQLLAATGLLPRKVHVPQWLSFGLGSFFETPLGAYWQGTGAPSWRYLKKYKVWENFKELDPADTALRYVVTDRYFHLADDRKDESYVLKGRTMSWALTYYLMKNHLEGVLRYCQELNNLPRDMEFDDKVLVGCFARAFGLADSARPNDTSPAKVRDLAFSWYDAISKTPLEDPEALQSAIKEETARRRKKTEGDNKPPANKPSQGQGQGQGQGLGRGPAQ